MTDSSTETRRTDARQLSLPIRAYRSAMRLLPVYSGLTPLSFNRVTNPLFGPTRVGVEATLLNGTRIRVDPNDYHGRVLYLFGTNDPKVHCVTQSLLAPGDRFLDIGANYSSIGLLAADAVGPTGQVHLFEPQPDICDAVEEAIRAGGHTNVTLHRVGLMDRDDELKLAQPNCHSGMATFVACDDPGWETRNLPVRNVATYLPPLVEGAPFGVKLDVEGAEPYVMPWLIDQPTLRFIIFEGIRNQTELWTMLHEGGLNVYGLCRRVVGMRVQRLESASQMGDFHDLLAIRLNGQTSPPQHVHPRALRSIMAAR